MAERDEFSESTKRFVALRAGHRCSFPGCLQGTVGPSDESPTAITNIGVAAHICAAAPGGIRLYIFQPLSFIFLISSTKSLMGNQFFLFGVPLRRTWYSLQLQSSRITSCRAWRQPDCRPIVVYLQEELQNSSNIFLPVNNASASLLGPFPRRSANDASAFSSTSMKYDSLHPYL
jgi:hypothetical protein